MSTVGVNDGVLTIVGNLDTGNRVTVKATARGRLISAIVNGKRRSFSRLGLAGLDIIGGSARDVITVAANVKLATTIDGAGGNDAITGGSAGDTLRGGLGNDTLRGGAGDDYLDGGDGTNALIGGTGVNTLVNIVDYVPEAGGTLVESPAPRPTALLRANGSIAPFGIDVTTFRNADGSFVRPSDGIDDTTGIQAAIDSLDPYWGFPIGTTGMGGTVYLTGGVYDTSEPLRLPGTVTLAGDGPGSGIRYNGGYGSAIELIEVKDGNFNSAAGLRDLYIKADYAAGVGISASRRLFVLQFHARNITLDTAGWGINFEGHQTQNCYFEDVTVRTPGSGALLIEGNVNKVVGVKVVDWVRDGFFASPGLIVVKGDSNRIQDCVVGPLPAGSGSAYYISGYFPSLENNRADVSGVIPTLADGVAFTFDTAEGGTIDDLRGRKAQFINTVALEIGRQWVGPDVITLDDLLVRDDVSRLIVNEMSGPLTIGGVSRATTVLRPAADRVHVTRWADLPAELYFAGAPPVVNRQTTPSVAGGAPAYGVNVRDFAADAGMPGNLARDDTAAVQAAINALTRPRPRAAGGMAVGGIVYLPAGAYRITSPLLVPDGVVLVGEGAGTAIKYDGRAGAAIQFRTAGKSVVTGAGVENLCISAQSAGAIGAAPGTVLEGIRVQEVVLNCLGWGIDLRQCVTRNSAFDNVHQRDLGTGSVWVHGDGNRFYAINTEFGVRPGFVAEPALLVVRGDNNSIVGCVIEGVPDRSATAIYVNGSGLYWSHNWAEIQNTGIPDARNNDAFIFENVRNVAHVDNLHILTTVHRARFINSSVKIAQINNFGENFPLKDYFAFDSASTLEIDWVIARWWGTGALEGSGIRIVNLFTKDHP